jgi:putative protease
VLNDLRRRAVEALLATRAQASAIEVKDPEALEHSRRSVALLHPEVATTQSSLTVLVRTLDQLLALTTWKRTLPVATVYCDFEDVRKYADAVPVARDAGLSVALATTRIIKPNEEGLLRQVSAANPDAILIRNLAGLSFFRQERPDLDLLGDYSLNVANELTAGLFIRGGLRRLVPSYDLNWKQLHAMLQRIDPAFFEAVIHQHMPMFHMEHCVFCHTLSNGKDYRDCGRPCDTHRVELKAPDGQPHPLVADVGCRNTVFNASAQSALELVPQLKELGVRYFRVELLRQDAAETLALLTKYADVIAGRADGRQTVRGLRVLSQLGVTRGTFDYE